MSSFLFYVHFPKLDVNIQTPAKRPSPAQRRTDRHTHVFLPVSKRHVAIQPAELEAPKEAVIHQNIQDGCHLAKDENLEHKNQTSKWKKKIKKSRAKPPLEAPIVPQRTAETLKPPFKPPFKQIATLQQFNGKERELGCVDGADMCRSGSPCVLLSSVPAASCPG